MAKWDQEAQYGGTLCNIKPIGKNRGVAGKKKGGGKRQRKKGVKKHTRRNPSLK